MNLDQNHEKVSPEQQRRESQLVDRVVASYDATPDPRLKQLMQALTHHLHAFVREVRLTEQEWRRAIEFLIAVGHITDDRRQEFILLSDVLGVSMQTITVNNEAYANATEATVVGPFFVDGSPEIELGGDIAAGASGQPCWVEGTVTDTSGKPVPHALIEVWEADEDGFYDVQYNDDRVAARGHLFSDADGRYRFWAVAPTPYPIPDDGPVGQLLAAVGRSPMRAATCTSWSRRRDCAPWSRTSSSAAASCWTATASSACGTRLCWISRRSRPAPPRRTVGSWATAPGRGCASTSSWPLPRSCESAMPIAGVRARRMRVPSA